MTPSQHERLNGAEIAQMNRELKMARRRLEQINLALTRRDGHDAALAGEAQALTAQIAILEIQLMEQKNGYEP